VEALSEAEARTGPTSRPAEPERRVDRCTTGTALSDGLMMHSHLRMYRDGVRFFLIFRTLAHEWLRRRSNRDVTSEERRV
jgi:hypothetical protein